MVVRLCANQTSLSQIFYFSVLILPLFPALGILGLLGVMLVSWHSHLSQIVRDKTNWFWVILAVWLVINSYFARFPQEAWLGLANFLPFFALLLGISPLLDSIDKLKTLAWCLILPSLPVVILGLGQLWLNWESVPLVKTVLGWELIPQGVPPSRMSSVFIYANFLAVYLAIAFILSLGLWLDIWYQKTQPQWQLILVTTIILVDSIGLALTSSRNAWGIAFIAIMAFAVYLRWHLLVYGVIGAGIAVFWASFAPKFGQEWIRIIVPEFIWGRLSDRMYPDRPVETLRLTQWQFCWDRIQERPILGWGLRNFTPLYEEKTNFWFGHPHNLFLMLGMEVGVIATVLLSLMVSVIILRSFFVSRQFADFDNSIIILTYGMAFTGCVLFNLFDVTIFDLRVNTISWILLASLKGISSDRIKIKKRAGNNPDTTYN